MASQKKFKYFRHHPFVIPVVVFLVLFFISMAAIIGFGGQTIGAPDKRVVVLYIDGQKQVLPTRAKTVGDLLKRLEIQPAPKDIVEPNAETEISSNNFTINFYSSRSVFVKDEDRAEVLITAEPTPEKIAEEAGFKLYPEDIVERRPIEIDPLAVLDGGLVAEEVIIDRATPVRISLYGKMFDVRTHASTVGDLVFERGIDPSQATIFPKSQTSIKKNDLIFVTDPGRRIITIEEPIPQSSEIVNDFSLAVGERKVKNEGRPGKKAVLYEISKDGETRKILREVVLEKPVNKIIGQGIQVIVSNPSANVKLGQQMASSSYGWTGSEWLCLYSLWQRESGWSNTAGNPTTGAYGIPQALPGSKMGPGWQSDPTVQIRWGLGYIAGRYGTPCNAYQNFLNIGWY
jgi:resuscitation-promoting factor RpfB